MAASSSKQFKNICVLSGFHYGKYKKFVQAAVDLGRVIAERKLHLVYGGGERGLSRLVSEAVFTRGSQVLGIIPKAMKPLVCMSGPPIGEELVVNKLVPLLIVVALLSQRGAESRKARRLTLI
ncbi:cytokinin riboside 5'-monophosphate phosphoribohydrolase LOG8-like [Citrus clementina]|uniref:cytokinin riboside 5'-monophosphate phosphoribohydrolase LOG8-like n=1 Tax=Citrus clementina TaxID=85681 RepID=UPI000CED2EE3|nr:cytokinin riboside 5'-monophosphate phosphoribohydrolase LOG8-like [Citrus x clementina]